MADYYRAKFAEASASRAEVANRQVAIHLDPEASSLHGLSVPSTRALTGSDYPPAPRALQEGGLIGLNALRNYFGAAESVAPYEALSGGYALALCRTGSAIGPRPAGSSTI